MVSCFPDKWFSLKPSVPLSSFDKTVIKKKLLFEKKYQKSETLQCSFLKYYQSHFTTLSRRPVSNLSNFYDIHKIDLNLVKKVNGE